MAGDAGSPALTKEAVAHRPTVDPDTLADHAKQLLSGLRWIFKELLPEEILRLPESGAVGQYLKYYETHVIVVARVLASVQKGEPTAEALRELKATIDDYVITATDFARRAPRDVPPSPWARIPAALALLVVLGAPILARDPRFRAAWNSYLAVNQLLVENATAVGRYLGQQGAEIGRTLPGALTELRKAVEEITVKFSTDLVVKNRYKEQIDWLELDGDKVRHAAATVRDTTANLESGPLLQARRAQRL
jgi:hypothetical protein